MSEVTATAPVIAAAPVTAAPVAQLPAVAGPIASEAKVFAVVPAGANSPIVPFTNSPEWGYIQVASVTVNIGAVWARPSKRSALIKGEIETLQLVLREFVNPKDLSLKGKLYIREFMYNDAFMQDEEFETYRQQLNVSEDGDEDVMLKGIAKRAGAEGPFMTLEGVQILRFTEYVQYPTAQHGDILIQHDNGAEIKAWNAANPRKS